MIHFNNMTNNNNPVPVTYFDSELHNLVEEYITQQKSEFTLKGECTYNLYCAIEDGKAANTNKLIECNDLHQCD